MLSPLSDRFYYISPQLADLFEIDRGAAMTKRSVIWNIMQHLRYANFCMHIEEGWFRPGESMKGLFPGRDRIYFKDLRKTLSLHLATLPYPLTLPEIPIHIKDLNAEIRSVSDMPPMISHLDIFKKGGPRFKEWEKEMKRLISDLSE